MSMMGEDDPTRHGKMAPGWGRVSLQVPLPVVAIWRAEAATKGQSSVKMLGTVATGLLLGMPAPVRDELYLQVSRLSWKGLQDLTPEVLWQMLRAILAEHEAGRPVGKDWYVDRILSPEITLPPGRRPGDGTKRARGA